MEVAEKVADRWRWQIRPPKKLVFKNENPKKKSGEQVGKYLPLLPLLPPQYYALNIQFNI